MAGKVTIWTVIIGGVAIWLAASSWCDPYHSWHTPDVSDRGYHPEPVHAPRMAGAALAFATWLFQTAFPGAMINKFARSLSAANC